MSPGNLAPKSCKFGAHRALLMATESTLSHPPSCLVKHAVNCPERSLAGHSPHYSVRNSENYLGGHPASYRTGYLPENPESCRADCLDSNSADPSADCPDNRPERNPESNLPSNWAGNLQDDSESNSAGYLPHCLASYLEIHDPCRSAAKRQANGYSSLTTLRTACA